MEAERIRCLGCIRIQLFIMEIKNVRDIIYASISLKRFKGLNKEVRDKVLYYTFEKHIRVNVENRVDRMVGNSVSARVKMTILIWIDNEKRKI